MSNNDTANRKELDQQIGRVGKQLAQEKDQKRRQNLRDQARNLVRRRSYHVDDNEIVSYANRKESVLLLSLWDDLTEADAYDGKNKTFHDKVMGKEEEKKKDKKKNQKLNMIVKDRPESERAPREVDKAFDRIMKFGRKHPLRVRQGSTTTADGEREHTPPLETRSRYDYVSPAEMQKKRNEQRKDQQRRMQQSNVKETMNFTDYCDSLVEPIFEVKGALPKCPPGYKYSPQQKQCVPKTDKDDVRKDKGGSKDSNPSNGPGYNVWGRTGVNGDGYAWAEPNNWDTDAYDGPSGGMYN